MQSKHYVLLGSGLAVAIAAGVGIATMQSKSPETVAEPPAATVSAPTTPVRITPTPDPSPAKPAAVPHSTASAPVPATSEAPVSQPPAAAPAQAAVSQERCELTMALVADPNPPLNVRATPSSSGIVVGQVKNGTYVTVVDQKNGWLQISVPLEGWISQNQTERGCNQLTARIRFPAGTNSTRIADRFIGAGTHRYLLTASKGQTLTLTAEGKVLPGVIAPDGKTLTPPQDAPSWTSQLPSSGDYTLLLDSNYKGYDYAFSVKVN